MKAICYKLSCIVFFGMMSCTPTYRIAKSPLCVDIKKQEFTFEEVNEIEKKLDSLFPDSNYKLKNKGSHLDFKTDYENIQGIEISLNKPRIIFKQFEKNENTENKEIPQVLKNFKNFKSPEALREPGHYYSNFVGYVESEEELLEINRTLEKQDFYLASENLYWILDPRMFNAKEPERFYLMEINDLYEIQGDNLGLLYDDVKASYSAENFEPRILFTLNDCGVTELKKKLGDNQFRSYAVIIDDRLHSIQWLRIRPENQLSLFWFKTIEEAEEMVEKIRNMKTSLQIK